MHRPPVDADARYGQLTLLPTWCAREVLAMVLTVSRSGGIVAWPWSLPAQNRRVVFRAGCPGRRDSRSCAACVVAAGRRAGTSAGHETPQRPAALDARRVHRKARLAVLGIEELHGDGDCSRRGRAWAQGHA